MPASSRRSTQTVLFVAESETWHNSEKYTVLTAVRPSEKQETEVNRLRKYKARRQPRTRYRVAKYVRCERPETVVEL